MKIKEIIEKWKKKRCKHSWRMIAKAPIHEIGNDGVHSSIPKGILYVYVCSKCGKRKYIES